MIDKPSSWDGNRMTLTEYTKYVLSRWKPPNKKQYPVVYAVMGLAGEAGEVADQMKKLMRKFDDGLETREDVDALVLELGDVFYYLLATCYELGVPVEEVMWKNKEKLDERNRQK
jgi:NTP pyrophosphatase (non-canonical NTP hydrolase)